MALLELVNATKIYEIEKGFFNLQRTKIKAVNEVCISLEKSRTLGVVGESGCGKTTLAKLIVRLIPPTSGEIFFEGINISALKEKEIRPLRKNFQIVFQDPCGSLSPRLKIKDIIGEPLQAFNYKRQDIDKRTEELILQVGLDRQYLGRFPHQLSGGERQRVGIARALATGPRLLVLDEPVSSLDLSTQAQILNLLVSLQEKYQLGYFFIAHNLNIVRYISDEVAVMFCGQIVERGQTEDIYQNPRHPYTKILLSSMPSLKKRLQIKKDTQAFKKNREFGQKISSGCQFYNYCSSMKSDCQKTKPRLKKIGEGHWVSCLFAD